MSVTALPFSSVSTRAMAGMAVVVAVVARRCVGRELTKTQRRATAATAMATSHAAYEAVAKSMRRDSMLIRLGVAVGKGGDVFNRADGRLGPSGAIALGHAISAIGVAAATPITSLNLQHELIEDEGVNAVVAAILDVDAFDHTSVSSTLTTLNLSHNGLCDAGALAVARLVRDSPVLRVLDLSYNRIGSAGIEVVARAVGGRKTLATLWLNGNYRCGEDGALALAEAVAANPNMAVLDIGGTTPFYTAGVVAIARAAAHNPSMTHLSFDGLRIDDATVAAIADELAATKTLKTLNVSANAFGDAGAAALAPLLSFLTRLDASYNGRVGDAGAEAFARAVAQSETLVRLSVNGCSLEDPGIAALAAALARCAQLELMDAENQTNGDVDGAAQQTLRRAVERCATNRRMLALMSALVPRLTLRARRARAFLRSDGDDAIGHRVMGFLV